MSLVPDPSDLQRYLDFLRAAERALEQGFTNRREYHPMTRSKLVAFHVSIEGSPVTALFDPDGRFVEFTIASSAGALWRPQRAADPASAAQPIPSPGDREKRSERP